MQANRFRPCLEVLEARDTPSATLLSDGTLYVLGTEQADIIRVSTVTITPAPLPAPAASTNDPTDPAASNDDDAPTDPAPVNAAPVTQIVVTHTGGGETTTQTFDSAAVKQVVIRGQAGGDYIRNDTAIPSMIFGGRGADTIWGGSETDLIFGNEGRDYLYGAAGDDLLDGGMGDDVLFGMDGNDTLLGRLGNDSIFGGDGDDRMVGGEGNDTLVGEAGADWMFGVSLADSARTDPTDTINIGQGRGAAFRQAAEDFRNDALKIVSLQEQTVNFFERARLFLHRDI